MANKSKPTKAHSRLSLLALEPRIVFDGAMPVTDPALLDPADHNDTAAPLDAASRAVSLALPKEASSRREIVFVDDALSDLPGLLAGIGSHAQVVQIQHGQDGLSQIYIGPKVIDDEQRYTRQTGEFALVAAHGANGTQALGQYNALGEDDIRALTLCAAAQRLGQVRLARVSRPYVQAWGLLVHIATRGQPVDQGAFKAGQALKVKRIERLKNVCCAGVS